MNTLTISHRGEQRRFRLTNGGYCFDGKSISISIQTWANDEQSPYAANLSLVNYSISDGILRQGLQLSFKDDHLKGWDDQNTHANAYFDFYAKSVELIFKIVEINSSVLTVELTAFTPEYGYDDDLSDPNPMIGNFQLTSKAKRELWIPT